MEIDFKANTVLRNKKTLGNGYKYVDVLHYDGYYFISYFDKIIYNCVDKKISYHKNGSVFYEVYLKNDKYHRKYGSAYIEYHENGSVDYESYWINGKRHRKNRMTSLAWLHPSLLPARIWYDENGQVTKKFYYWKGKEISYEEFLELTKKT